MNMNVSPQLIDEIKTLIIESLQLEDITSEDIDTDAPLFAEGLALDSIDALELGIALQRRYKITLPAEAEETKHHFHSVRSLSELIMARGQTDEA